VLAEQVVRDGGTILRRSVGGFRFGPDKPRALITDAGEMPLDRLVSAAGAWSQRLTAQLGTSVPLEAERGYHVMFGPQAFGLKRALVSADRSVSLIQMYEGFRATGVAEFAAPDAPPDMRIADMVMRHAKALVPGLKGEAVSKWMGPRPSHPDSKPVIGRSPRHKNVYFAFGHDHLGLTMAGITGRLVAELATGQPTTVDLQPFRPDRF